METQNELEMEIGTKESVSLKPAKVTVREATIETVGEKGNKKVVLSVKHPDKEELIHISQLKYVKGNQIVESGTWLNLDEDKKIRMGSALAVLMEKFKAKTINGLVGQEIETVLDSKNYLCLKVY